MWLNNYIGIPFKEKGRDYSGVDCWGLVRLVYKEQYNIDLPSFANEYPTVEDVQRIHELIAQYKEAWEPINSPTEGSVVLFRIMGSETHIGLALNEQEFLHVREGADSVVDRFDSTIWKNRIIGHFKYTTNKSALLNAVPHPLRTERFTVPVPPGTSLDVLASWIVKEWNIAPELKAKITILINGEVIPEDKWANTILKDTDIVDYRAVPTGGNFGRIVLMIAIAVAAPYIAGALTGYTSAAAAAATMGTTVTTGLTVLNTAVTIGISLVGAALVNAIFPVRPPAEPRDPGQSERQLMVTGGANRSNPYGAIPIVLGKVRMTPPCGANNYITYENDRDSYLSMMLVWGYGPVTVDPATIRIGEVAYTDFTYATFADSSNMFITLDRKNDVTAQTAKFNAIYGSDVDQVQKNQELVCDGNPETTVTPGIWTEAATVQKVDSVTVALHFPQGIRKVKVKGDGAGDESTAPVGIDIEYKLGAGAWTPWKTLSVGADAIKKDAFTITHTLTLTSTATAGVQVRVRRTTGDNTEDNPDWRYSHQAVFLSASFIYNSAPAVDPLNCKIAKTALRIKASDQFNGQIEGINAVVQTYCLAYNGSTWAMGNTNNPADLFRYVLQHPANPQRVLDADVSEKINLAQIQYWWNYCNQTRSYTDPLTGITTTYKLTFNSAIAAQRSILDVLRDICAAGRASPAMVDGKWTVVIDEPKSTIVQHFTPHNSWGFEGQRSLPKLPDGLRVNFFDEDQDYQESEIIIYRSGKSQANAELFESITLPGVTKKEMIIDHARWHMAQAQLRRESYTLNTDIEYLVCNRGDRVKLTHDVPMWGLGSGRIKNRIAAKIFELDEPVAIDDATNYTIRVRGASGSSTERVIQKQFTVSGINRTANIVTVTLSEAHPLSVGDQVVVASSVTALNGTVTVTAVTSTTFSYSKVGTAVTQQVATGTTTLVDDYYTKIMVTAATTSTEINAGDLFLFGLYQQESQDLIVLNVEPSTNKTARLTLVDYGVTSTYNIFTDYKTLTSDTVFETGINLAPELNRGSFRSTDKPTITALTSDETAATAGTATDYTWRIRVAFANIVPDLPATTSKVECQYDMSTSTSSSNYRSIIVDHLASTVYIPNVTKGEIYKVRLRYLGSDGSIGPWTGWTTHTVSGKTVGPSDPLGFSYGLKDTGIVFSWNSSGDVDYKATVIKYTTTIPTGTETAAQKLAAWNAATTIFEGNASTWTWTTPATSKYRVMIKHKDTSDNLSTNFAESTIDYVSLILASLQVDLSNPIPVVSYSPNTSTPILAGTGTQIRVLQGGTALKYDAVGTAAGRWKISAKVNGTGITSGAIDAVVNPTTGDDYATVANLTAFTATSSTTVTYTITGVSTLGDAFTLTRVHTYYTVKPGDSTALVYAYKRSATAPTDNPGAVEWSFTSASITTTPLANSWSKTIVAGTDPLWVVVAAAASNTGTDNIAANEWSSPVQYSANGLNTAVVRLYARNSSTSTAPALATTGSTTYTFSTNTITGQPSGWSQVVPAASGGNVIWTIQAVASNTANTDTIANTEYSAPVVYGQQGDTGISSIVVLAYKRSATAPTDNPGNVDYSFATNVITTPTLANSWSKTIVAGTDPLWVTAATAASNTGTDGILAAEWSTPIKFVENGLNTLSIFLYARNNSTSTAPTLATTGNATYTFATGAITGQPAGWTADIPAASNGTTIWVTQATAAGSGTTDTIANTEWSTPVILTQQGNQGPRGQYGYVYFATAQATAPATPAATDYNFDTGAFTGLTASWSTSVNVGAVPANNANLKYWASKFTVSEASFGGTKTITFATPAAHLNLDGIVTFTNLTNATDKTNTAATIIDGAAIKTNTIDANRIKADTIQVGQQIKSADGSMIIDFTSTGKYISITA